MSIKSLVALLVLLGLPAFAAAQATPPATATEMTAHQILSGNAAGITHPGHRIIRSQAGFQALLRNIFGYLPPSPPEVDFSRQVLIYYSLGTAEHGEEKVYIRSGQLSHGVLHINVEIGVPAESCLTTPSMSAPYAIAALPFPASMVERAEFSVVRKSYPCR